MDSDPAAPRFGSPAVETAVLLTQAEALLARALGQALRPHGLSWPQALSLLVLDQQEAPISATRLVEHLGLGRTAMTSVVDRLERHGWVERRPSARDRRVAELRLTASGRQTVEEIRPLLTAAIDGHFSGLPARELALWHAGIDRLTAVLRTATPGAGGGED